MAIDPFSCKICGRPLARDFRGDYHEKCRQKKSRDKKLAGKRAFQIGKDIDRLYATYKTGAIDIDSAILYHNTLLRKLQQLTKQLSADLEEKNQ